MCAIGYLIAGFMGTPAVALIVETVILVGGIVVLSKYMHYNNRDEIDRQ